MARFPEQKRRFLVAKLGEAKVRRLEEALPRWAKELEDAGVTYKAAPDSPVSEYINDLVSGLKPATTAIKQLESIPHVGPYLADLARMRSISIERSTQ